MILWFFALFDLLMLGAFIANYFDLLPWRIIFFACVAIVGKAILFNDKFLSFIDIIAAIFLFITLFKNSLLITIIFSLYFLYKVVISF